MERRYSNNSIYYAGKALVISLLKGNDAARACYRYGRGEYSRESLLVSLLREN